MTEYLEINFELLSQQESDQEIVLALLADLGFEGFIQEEGRILAYIGADVFSSGELESLLAGVTEKIKSYQVNHIPGQNWNETWEKAYSPVIISGKCMVRAPFHPPQGDMEYDLIISPKMSFGTAHHETTRQMLEFMLNSDWSGQKLLDLGCGTGILAVLAEKMGARNIIAMDNDPLACRNARENLEMNKCRNIQVIPGELNSLEEFEFHSILGNINLNVLLKEMRNLSLRLMNNGIAVLSGFYKNDLKDLDVVARKNGLSLIMDQSLNRWTVAVFRKGD
ncbi:50S ribosomal protein L11 methyltransferase [Bacteroidota bacterium]